MSHKEIIKKILKETESSDVKIRDDAVEALGDFIENKAARRDQLQIIINELGKLLNKEKSELVVESILNVLSKAKYNEYELQLPIAIITERYPTYKGSAKEHAEYIIGNS